MRVLLIEDQLGLLQPLAEALTEAGHEIVAAATFPVGDDLLGAHSLRWNALIADVRLPGGNGLDLAAKAERCGVPALLITGHPEEIIALATRGIRHLCKPFDLTALTDWLDGLHPKSIC